MENEKPGEKPGEERSVVQERLNWQVACRDDMKVGQALYAGEPIDEMHQLSDAGLLDEFFVFLKDLGMLEAFEQISQSGVQRTLVPTVQFVLLYFLKVLLGGESMNELPRVLFSDLALMELVGFNAHQCESGLTKGLAVEGFRYEQLDTKEDVGPGTDAACGGRPPTRPGGHRRRRRWEQAGGGARD